MRKPQPINGDDPTKRVGIWIRVSTEDQARGESPEHHEKRARAYAEGKAWRIREIYHLEGVSGKSVREHPEAKRMLAHVASGHITGLIFSKLARLARNTRELLDFADYFRDHDADLISLQESIDTTSPAGRLFYTMIAAMAQWEREEIAERVAASVPIRAKLGKSTGGAAPFGYQWQDRQLVVEPSEATIRRLLYELFLEHKRKKAVARILNERGYRTRSGAKWSDTTVERLIRDSTAKGLRRANYTRSTGDKKHWILKPQSEWVLSPVEPIVPEDLWSQCNAILDDRRAKAKPPARRPTHLFAGVVSCHCGGRMYADANYKTVKYICRSCRNKITPDDLEAVFHEQLKSFFLSPDEVADYVGVADEEIRAKEERLGVLEAEAEKVRADMDRVYRLYMGDNISPDGFGRTYRPLEERLKQLEEEVPRLQGEADFMKVQFLARDEILSGAKDLYERWPALTASEKRAIIEAVVGAVRVGRSEVEIDLAYFPGPAEVAGNWQRNLGAALPFTCWTLRGGKPRVFPRGYPHGPRTLGERIRQRRMDLGLTQQTLAEKLGCWEVTVAAWERDESVPLARRWPSIERTLGPGLVPERDGLPGRIRAARLRLGLTQEELAARAGVDIRTVRNAELAIHPPSRMTLRKLRTILGESV